MDISIPLHINEEHIKIIECILSSRMQTSTPAEICRLIGMNKRKVWYRLNVLLKSGLVSKNGKGRYKVTTRGKLLYNLLNLLRENDSVVWTTEGFYEANLNNLKVALDGIHIDDNVWHRFLSFLDKTLSLQGVFSIEYLIILLCYYLLSNGEESICRYLTKSMIYIPNIYLCTTQVWSRAFYRKVLENNIRGNALLLVKNNILNIDRPEYVNGLYAIGNYKRTPRVDVPLSGTNWMESVAKVEELEDFKEIENNEHKIFYTTHTKHITINVNEEHFTPELNDRVRKLALQCGVSLIVKLKQHKALSDDLMVTSVLNNVKSGIEVLFAKHSYYGDNLITKDGYVLYRDVEKPSAVLLTISEVNLEKLETHKLHELLLNDGLATIYSYARSKAERVHIKGEKSAIHNYVIFKGIRNAPVEHAVTFLKRMKNEFANNFGEELHLGVDEMTLELLSYVERYPPLKVKIADVFDLKMNILRFVKVKYPLLSIVYSS
ncbi:MAG: hypothetical protein QXH96_00015 [Candidatus Geothermarchaeota archaeon]